MQKTLGGIAVLIGKEFRNRVVIVQSKSEDILWIKLKKDQWNIKRDIVIGGIYNSPSNSSYSMRGGNEMWEPLESETQHYALENDMLIESDKTTSIYNVSTRVLSKK